LEPLVSQLIGDAPIHIDFWDGSSLGPEDGKGTLRIKSPNALRRIIWAPNELGPGRAYVAGEIDALKPAGTHLSSSARALPAAVRAAA
jgi:cyclopropane-fatty-acyl-phospholipid synthase